MTVKKEILLAFYGDDFTGSTDALEFLSRAGAKTVLFLTHPTKDLLAKFESIDAFGVAGMTRTMAPKEMELELLEAFRAMKAFHPNHIHYKVCSTFDSSPEIGSIGTAISAAQEVFPQNYTPIVVAAPNLGRYSAFGNLFARMGIGSKGEIYRLDQHPSMSRHPTTPAEESDLRLHLAKQTDQQMGLIDLVDLSAGHKTMLEKVEQLVKEGDSIIFYDAMYENQMVEIGEVLEASRTSDSFFSVGSSGIEKALGDFWQREDRLTSSVQWQPLNDEGPILVLSGSASPITGDQIDYAISQGFVSIEVDPQVFDNELIDLLIQEYVEKIIEAIKLEKSVILHTCKGSEDRRIATIKSKLSSRGWTTATQRKETPKRFGRVLGEVAKKALKAVKVKRLIIAGGDTSSYVARNLGIEAVEMIAPVYPGAPMCKAYGDSAVEGLQVNLKGGQVGDEVYFVSIKNGKFG